MAETKDDQAKPLTPLYILRSDQPNEDQYHHDQTKHFQSRSKVILCCGTGASLTLLIAVTFIVLYLTVFHLRNGSLAVESISLIQPLDLVNGKVNTSRNVTISMEISLRNPNRVSFKVKDVTLSFYYGEVMVTGERIGSSITIPVKVLAKAKVKMNLTAEIVTTKLLASVPDLMADLNKGIDIKCRVLVTGRVTITKSIKKTVHLQTDCSMKMMMNNLSNLTCPLFRTGNAQKHVQIH